MPPHGWCNCKAIQLTIADSAISSQATMFCHCANCSRSSGGTGTCIMQVDNNDLSISGKPKAWIDHDTTTGNPLARDFCGECGCQVSSRTEAFPGKTFVKMGLFDEIPNPDTEQFVKRRQKWEVPFPGSEKQVEGLAE